MDSVVVHLTGGLGNQMFQYALGRAISINRNCDLYLNTSFYKKYNKFSCGLLNYDVKAKFINEDSVYNNKYLRYIAKSLSNYGLNILSNSFYEKKLFSYDYDVYKNKFKIYYGTWQSYKYFVGISDVLLSDYKLIKIIDKEVIKYAENINHSNSVSLHIRRGDYFNEKKLRRIHGILTMDYYYQAMSIFPENSVFYVFSDDIEWVKDNLKTSKRIVYVRTNENNPEKEIYLMSLCAGNIISNSTFSWWGAWLNTKINKIVVAPKKWYANQKTSSDLIPNNWLII